MNTQFSNIVYPLLRSALDLRDRLVAGESPDLDAERHKLVELLRADGEARRLTDYVGDGGSFLGARYALACWVDELMIVHSPPAWSERWAGRVLEFELFGTRDRAFRFWEQLKIALRRPEAPRSNVAPGPDVLEAYFLCIVLGFRGDLRRDPAEVRAFVEEIRPQFTRATPWVSPRDLGVETNVEPLVGQQSFFKVAFRHGAVFAALLLVLAVLWKFLNPTL